MPPKVKIKKEDIIHCAYEIVRKEGMSAVNARRIAQELHCSVQPIFSNFDNMEDLKNDVIKLAFRQYLAYMTTSQVNSYLAMGMNYIALAQKEPKLFEILFMSEKNQSFQEFYREMIPDFQYVAQSILQTVDLEPQKLRDFHQRMWIYVHGIATLLANHTIVLTTTQIEELLKAQFKALILYEKNEQKKED